MAAARNLSAHALKLYMYFAANAEGFNLALSPADIQSTINMARSTYADQFRILVSKGYLVQKSGNTYEFFEVPQTSAGNNNKSSMTSDGYNFEDDTFDGQDSPNVVNASASEDTEINNINKIINNIINMLMIVVIIRITLPVPLL